MKQTVRHLFTALLALFTGVSLSAQITTASISGMVKDTKGEAMVGATVKATHIPSGTVYFITTQANGKYFISGMRIGGPYEISISYVGYTPEKITDVTLSLGDESKYDIVLKDDTVTLGEVIVVAEQNAAINPNRTGAQEVFTKERMSRIPSINRSLDDFTKLTPMASGRNFAGTSYRFNNVTVDGASFNNSFGLSSSLGASGVEPISLESIEQIQVMIAPFDVRNGAFTGGGINSVTKSGNNNFEGSAYYFMKNANLQGYKQRDVTVEKNDFYKNQFGFSLSGPILKNRLFFFVNAEFDRQNSPVNWRPRATDKDPVTGDYSAADVKTLEEISKYMEDNFKYNPGKYIVTESPTLANKITARLDWNINPSNTFSFKYFHLTSYNTNNPSTSGAMKNGRGPNAFAIPFSSAYYRTNNNFNIFIADLHTIVSPRMSNSLTIGYSRLRDFREMDGGFFPEVNIADGSMPVVVDNKTGRRSSNSNSMTTFGTEANSYNNKLDTDIFQIQDNFTINLDKHQLTIGTQSDYRSFVNGYANSFAGQWQFNSWDDFKADVEAHKAWVAAGSPAGTRPKSLATNYAQNYSLQDGFPFAKVDVLSIGFYMQDKWSIRDNFNVTMGLRMDMPIFMTDLMKNPEVEKLTFQDGRKIDVSKYPGTTVLFSPRLGFNWDVFSDKTLQIRGGSGIFTGTPPYVWLSNQAGNNGLLFGRSLDSHAFDGVVNLPRPTGAGAQKVQIAVTDENFKYPQLWKSNIAIDYSFGDGWIATAEMLFNKDINAIYHKDINHPNLNSADVVRLNGADDRPIYLNRSLNKSIVDAILMTNTSKGYSIYTTLQLQKNFMRGPLDGLYLNASYTFGKAMSVTDGTSSVASSAYKYRASVIPDADELGYSAGSFPHRVLVQASYKKPWNKNFATTIGVVYQMYMPFRYSYTYSGDINNDGERYSFNDLMFVPATRDQIRITPAPGDKRTPDEIWDRMDAFFNQDPYLKTRRGMYTERNGGKAPYVHQLDLSLSQDFTLPQSNGKKHTLRLSVDVNNFLNLINKNWGVQKTTVLNYQQYQYLIMQEAPNAKNNYTPGFTTAIDKKTGKDAVTQTFKDFISPASRWSMMIGIKYIFN